MRLTIPVAASDTRPIKIFASVEDSKDLKNLKDHKADATERTIIPLPRGHRFVRSHSGSLGKTVVIPIALSSSVIGDGLKLTIRRESGLVGPISSALDELIDYPYGCVEQTMSRFMPAVVAGGAMKEAEIETPLDKRLVEVCAKSIARLQDFQHRDGGWGWWKLDASNDYMTAYVLKGLARCQDTGYPVPQQMIENSKRYLIERFSQNRLSGRQPHDIKQISLPVYVMHSLATLFSISSDYEKMRPRLAESIESFEDRGESLNLLDQILLADSWRLLGNKRLAKQRLTRLLREFKKIGRGKQMIVEAAALLELGTALDPENPRWQQLAQRLVLARNGTGWGDTLTTSAAVRGLSSALRSPSVDNIPVAVRLDGRQVGVLKPGNNSPIKFNAKSIKQITLTPTKPGSHDFYSIHLEGYLEKPPKNTRKPTITLRSRVFIQQPTRREVLLDRSSHLVLQRGSTLEVEFEIKLDQPVSHARLTFPRPCGVELVQMPKLIDGLVAFEKRDEEVDWKRF